ncbi:MAG TPA: c-type cytochrome domain-containing protein [Verrucomicrobiales bacterium]|nr:c-type cytochrome domain-containing protein [Verrucomicrobiales bacterium]
MGLRSCLWITLLLSLPAWAAAQDDAKRGDAAPDGRYAAQIAPLLREYCAGCHNPDDYEGGFSVENFASLMEGGDSGAALIPGRSEESLVWKLVSGAEKPYMPPRREPQPPREALEALKGWIDAGCPGPPPEETGLPSPAFPLLPAAKVNAAAITALGYDPSGEHLALGRYGSVLLLDAVRLQPVRTFEGAPGKIAALHISQDGSRIVAAGGVAGLSGEATLWSLADATLLRRIGAAEHQDLLYAAEFSPAGDLVATAGYDRSIRLWDVETGDLLHALEGHNGAVYDLAFSPDGAVLASASADQTVKLWQVDSGQRLDTLNQPLAEQLAVAFAPGGDRLYIGGADNRIRAYDFVSRQDLAANPLREVRFAHEGAIVALAISPDGRWLVSAGDEPAVALWELPALSLARRFSGLSDVPTALAIDSASAVVAVAVMDGAMEIFALRPAWTSPPGAAVSAPPSPADLAAEAPEEPPPPNAVEESEPNDGPATANLARAPGVVTGRIQEPGDADLYTFQAQAGEVLVLEIRAARDQSPLDSFIEVLDAEGEPVERAVLEAVRDSWFTFRGKDSFTSDDFRLHNWEEMELNEHLYAGGELVRLWLYPRGPDSGFKVYPGFGRRFTYLDTTARTHALNAPCYIVRQHPPGTEPPPNGLPVFRVHYENDDDARRRFERDSHLLFTPPRDAAYLIRVTDVRGFGGEEFRYSLTVRPAQPDFRVHLDGADPAVSPGSGREFQLRAERIDGFEGDIRVDISGLPTGFHATSPVVIEAGQETAVGVISALADASAPPPESTGLTRLTAAATIGGREVVHEAGSFGEIRLADPGKIRVRILPSDGGEEANAKPGEPFHFPLRPGETITARVRIERNGFDGPVSFGADDSGRNLPHGVFVDNIGLNGLLIPEGAAERTFFLTASPQAKPMTRYFHLRVTVAGNDASWPALLELRP